MVLGTVGSLSPPSCTQLNGAAQTATGKHRIESGGEEAQTHPHHKAAECPVGPEPHPLMRRLVKEQRPQTLLTHQHSPFFTSPEPAFLGHHESPRTGLRRGGDDGKSHQRGSVWEKAAEPSDCGPFISNSPPGPAPPAGRSWA